MPGYSYFALSVICLLTVYIPLFWVLGEFKDTSRNMKRFFIGFMPIGLACIAWIEFGGLDWSRSAIQSRLRGFWEPHSGADT